MPTLLVFYKILHQQRFVLASIKIYAGGLSNRKQHFAGKNDFLYQQMPASAADNGVRQHLKTHVLAEIASCVERYMSFVRESLL